MINAPVQIAFYKKVVPWDLGAWFIRLWTNSPYSHCEIIIDGKSYTSSVQDGGVRVKFIPYNADSWDYISVPWADKVAILRYFGITSGTPYGWGALILRQLFNIRGNDGKQFCSEWVAEDLGIPDAGIYSPIGVFDVCGFINKK